MRHTPSAPPTLSFTGHQTFAFRYTWLKKGFDAVTADPGVFSSEDASVTLGVGKNMVSAIRHGCRVSGLIEMWTRQHADLFEAPAARSFQQGKRGQFVPTDFGYSVFGDSGLDPYLDDPGTLWLLHWRLATNMALATTWYWGFNVSRKHRFTLGTFKQGLSEWAQQQRPEMRPVSENTYHRDVNCFIRTYCPARQGDLFAEETFDCPLVELNLIAELPDGTGYEFQRGAKETLPAAVVGYALKAFWEARFAGRESLSFTDLLDAPCSPGRVFRLDADSLVNYIEEIAAMTDGALRYDDTAGLKQIYRTRDFDQTALLTRYYGDG